MIRQFLRPVVAAFIAGCLLLVNSGASSKAEAPISESAALRAASDLKTYLESRAAAEPLRRLEEIMRKASAKNALNGYAMALMLAGSPGDALYVLCEAAACSPRDFLPFNNLGALLNDLGQYERALAFLRYADELSPDNPMVLSNRGMAELGQGRAGEAEKLFKRAVALAPKHPQANFALGMMARRRNELDAAERLLNASLDGSYTSAAAEALGDLRRAARRSGASKARPAKEPPPVPPLATQAGQATRVKLLTVELPNSASAIAARKAFEAELERLGPAVQAMQTEALGFVSQAREEAQRTSTEARPSPGGGAKIFRLTPDKAKRGLQSAELWWDRLKGIENAFLADIDARIREALSARGELEKAAFAEEMKCGSLPAGSQRNNCREEVRRRACARHFEMFDPIAPEIAALYARFAPQWEAAAEAYHRTVNYWASFIPDPMEAARTRAGARSGPLNEYGAAILPRMVMMTAALAPHQSCLSAPPPSQSIEGELRLEDFKVPCSMPGLGLDLVIVSFHVDCTAVTVAGDFGPLAIELEWDFVRKTGTLFLGAEAGIEAGMGLAFESSLRTGVVLSFDRDSMTDIGLELKAEVGIKLGEVLSADRGGAEAGVRIGLNSGLTTW